MEKSPDVDAGCHEISHLDKAVLLVIFTVIVHKSSLHRRSHRIWKGSATLQRSDVTLWVCKVTRCPSKPLHILFPVTSSFLSPYKLLAYKVFSPLLQSHSSYPTQSAEQPQQDRLQRCPGITMFSKCTSKDHHTMPTTRSISSLVRQAKTSAE